MWVDEVESGDVIAWCGRPVHVERVVPVVSSGQRRGRHLFVCEENNGKMHRLHYWDSERVDLCPVV